MWSWLTKAKLPTDNLWALRQQHFLVTRYVPDKRQSHYIVPGALLDNNSHIIVCQVVVQTPSYWLYAVTLFCDKVWSWLTLVSSPDANVWSYFPIVTLTSYKVCFWIATSTLQVTMYGSGLRQPN